MSHDSSQIVSSSTRPHFSSIEQRGVRLPPPAGARIPLSGCSWPENHGLATDDMRSIFDMLNFPSGDHGAVCRRCKEVDDHFNFDTDGTVGHLLDARMADFHSRLVYESFHIHTVLQYVKGSVTELVTTVLHRAKHGPGNWGPSPDHPESFALIWEIMRQLVPSSLRGIIVDKEHWSKLRTSAFRRTAWTKKSRTWPLE